MNMDKLRATLQSYKSTEVDWDGYGAPPINHINIDRAIAVANSLEEMGAPVPKAMASDSSVSLYWDKGAYIEILFDCNNPTFSNQSEDEDCAVVVIDDSQELNRGWDISYEELPQIIQEIKQYFAS